VPYYVSCVEALDQGEKWAVRSLVGRASRKESGAAFFRGGAGIFIVVSVEQPQPSQSARKAGPPARIVAHLNELRKKTNVLKALQSETSAELDALMPSILDKAFRGAPARGQECPRYTGRAQTG
jgi:hypothetical protein